MAGVLTSISVAIFLGALISIAVLAMMVLIGIWVYRDAVSKEMNGVLWTLVVLLVPSFIGLIIYLIVRIDAKKVTCSKCMQKVNGNSKFCSKCGQELEPVIEVSKEDEKLRKSQKHILIGFFATLGGVVIAIILMIALLLSGIVGAVGSGVRAVSSITNDAFDGMSDLDDVRGMLKSLDTLFSREGFDINVDDDDVTITTGDGEEIIHVNADTDQVHVNTAELYRLLEEYGIDYNTLLSEDELEQAVDEYVDNYVDSMCDALDAAIEEGDWSAFGDCEEKFARAQKIELTHFGDTAPAKVITDGKAIDDFADRLDIDDWDIGTIPQDAKEIGSISFISEYKGSNGKMNDFQACKLHVYQDIPYIVFEVAGIRTTLEISVEDMNYLNSLF